MDQVLVDNNVTGPIISGNEYTFVRDYVVSAPGGLATESSETFVILHDPDGPVLNGLPTNLTLPCGSEIPPPPIVTGYDVVYGDVDVGMVEEMMPDPCGGYMVQRTWSATDGCNNTTTGIQIITFIDNEGPILEIPADTTIYCPGTIPDAAYLSVSDACSDVEVSFSESTTTINGCEYDLARTWVARDGCGNTTTKTQIIEFRDTTAPTITVVNTMLVDVPNGGDLIMYGCDNPQVAMTDILATDECCPIPTDNIVTADILKASNVCDLFGYYRRWECSYEVTDAAGNMSTFYFNVLQYDTTSPVISGVGEAYIEAACDSVIPEPSDSVTGYDECSLSIHPEFSETQYFDPSDSSKYALVRNWWMKDNCDNIGRAQQIVAVCGFDTTLLSSSIGNSVWFDENQNGIFEESEKGIDGVKVFLYQKASNGSGETALIDSTLTSTIAGLTGQFAFEQLKPGSYQLGFATPEHMQITIANVGGNEDFDSDADPATGLTEFVLLQMQEDVTFLDAGLIAQEPFNVDLASLNVRTVNCQNEVSWTTKRELGVETFTVQRSDDGQSYEDLGLLRAHGQSAGSLSYVFLDSRPVKRSTYRLMMKDDQGDVIYSDSKMMNLRCISKLTSLKLFPNPTVYETTVEMELSARSEVTFELYNQLGSLLSTSKRKMTAGVHREKIDMDHLPNGVYWISIKVDGYIQNETIIKNGKTF